MSEHEDRNRPVPRECPHCGTPALLLPPVGDREDYECPRCGAFSISGSEAAKANFDAKKAWFVEGDGRRSLAMP